MTEGYYETIGRILNNSFSQNKDPFNEIKITGTARKEEQDSQDIKKKSLQSENVQDFYKREKTQTIRESYHTNVNKQQAEFYKLKFPKVPVPKYLIEDFLTLKLAPGSSFEECKASWKSLLKRYHPDLQDSANTQDVEVIIRINNSFRRIEEWFGSYKD